MTEDNTEVQSGRLLDPPTTHFRSLELSFFDVDQLHDLIHLLREYDSNGEEGKEFAG